VSRRAFDWYPTPAWATDVLLDLVQPAGLILEPCAGDCAIVAPMEARGLRVYTQDIDRSRDVDEFADACRREAYRIRPDWVISNPPFLYALPIVQESFKAARWGVAMLLRLSFLEPTEQRGCWLSKTTRRIT
jgi:hypothetical protein